MFLSSEPEQGYVGEHSKRKRGEKALEEGYSLLTRPTKSLFCFKESQLISLFRWLLEQRDPASSAQSLTHSLFPRQYHSSTNSLVGTGLLDPPSPTWPVELIMVGTTLVPCTYRFMEQRIKNNFSSSRGHLPSCSLENKCWGLKVRPGSRHTHRRGLAH